MNARASRLVALCLLGLMGCAGRPGAQELEGGSRAQANPPVR